MNDVTIKPGDCNALVSQAGNAAASAEAHQRAQTLVGGDDTGERGEIQVWSPDTAIIRRDTRHALGGLGVVLAVVMAATVLHIPAMLCIAAIPALYYTWLCGATLPAARKPRYITTDGDGLGVTTQSGSSYCRWDEIEVAHFNFVDGLVIKTRQGEGIHGNLYGYSIPEIRQLFDLIVRNAGLVPQRTRLRLEGKLYVRPGQPLNSSRVRALGRGEQTVEPVVCSDGFGSKIPE